MIVFHKKKPHNQKIHTCSLAFFNNLSLFLLNDDSLVTNKDVGDWPNENNSHKVVANAHTSPLDVHLLAVGQESISNSKLNQCTSDSLV